MPTLLPLVGTRASTVVANFLPLLVETIVPVGISTGVLPLLVKITLPVAGEVPTFLLPDAGPVPVTLVSNTSVVAGRV